MTLALVVLAVGWRVPLPGLDPDGLRALQEAPTGISPAFSIFALYLTPILTVLAYVEIAKLVFPPLDRWPRASVRKACRHDVAILVLCLMLAVFQGGGVILALATGGLAEADSLGFVVTGLACFVASTALLVWLNDRLRTETLGEGFWFLLAAMVVAGFSDEASLMAEQARMGALTAGAILLLVLSSIAGAVLAVFANRLLERNTAADGAARTSLLLWPPLLGGVVAGHVVAMLPAGVPGWPVAWPSFPPTAYLALTVLCIPVFVFLYARRFRTAREGAAVEWPVPVLLVTATVQMVLCGGLWAVQVSVGVPPAIRAANCLSWRRCCSPCVVHTWSRDADLAMKRCPAGRGTT
ncbi:MAG: hypothetical protein ABTQ31_19315 [Rhizobiaceae bacterium]